jgi:hypothetical protein
VDEARVSELESAVADVGALLLGAQKYRRAAGAEGARLRQDALALGDAARRLHRRDGFDAATVATLLDEAHALADRLRALVAAVRASAAYRDAVAAHAIADEATLARVLPEIFADLEPAPRRGPLFAPLPWLRRGRLRPVEELTADIVGIAREGLPAEGDDLSRGADPELPAVVLGATMPEEPVVLRLAAEDVRGPLHRLAESGEYLVHVPRLRAPLTVAIAADFAPDEQLRLELAPEDYARHRDALVAALAAAGVAVDVA